MGMNARLATRVLGTGVIALATLGVIGCAGTQTRSTIGAQDPIAGSVSMEVDPADADRVFDATRDSLMDFRFAIDRVDAARGVITTRPKRTAGLATPWDREQSGLDQEWEDLLNEQRRIVRVRFERSGGEGTPITRARVWVELVRTHRANWRVQSESVRLSSHARSRDTMGRPEPISSREVIGLDERLARRLVDAISDRLRDADDGR